MVAAASKYDCVWWKTATHLANLAWRLLVRSATLTPCEPEHKYRLNNGWRDSRGGRTNWSWRQKAIVGDVGPKSEKCHKERGMARQSVDQRQADTKANGNQNQAIINTKMRSGTGWKLAAEWKLCCVTQWHDRIWWNLAICMAYKRRRRLYSIFQFQCLCHGRKNKHRTPALCEGGLSLWLVWLGKCLCSFMCKAAYLAACMCVTHTAVNASLRHTNNNWSQLLDKSFYRVYQKGEIYVLDMWAVPVCVNVAEKHTDRYISWAGIVSQSKPYLNSMNVNWDNTKCQRQVTNQNVLFRMLYGMKTALDCDLHCDIAEFCIFVRRGVFSVLSTPCRCSPF